jgi:hypothetical protein
MRINWKFIWAVCWLGAVFADRVFNLTPKLRVWLGAAEHATPDMFHERVRTGIVVLFCVVAIAPMVWPLIQRKLFLKKRRWYQLLRPAKRKPRARQTKTEQPDWWSRSKRTLTFWRRSN